jgi:hypothetical protein
VQLAVGADEGVDASRPALDPDAACRADVDFLGAGRGVLDVDSGFDVGDRPLREHDPAVDERHHVAGDVVAAEDRVRAPERADGCGVSEFGRDASERRRLIARQGSRRSARRSSAPLSRTRRTSSTWRRPRYFSVEGKATLDAVAT